MGPSYLLGNDKTTMAHTVGNMNKPTKGWINMRLKTPEQVTAIMVMNKHGGHINALKRKHDGHINALKRLNNADDRNVYQGMW